MTEANVLHFCHQSIHRSIVVVVLLVVSRPFILPITTNASCYCLPTRLPIIMSELKEYSLDEVAKHTTAESCWLIIGNDNNGESTVHNAQQFSFVGPSDNAAVNEDIQHNKQQRVPRDLFILASLC